MIKSSHGRQMGLPLGRLDIVVDDVGRIGHSRIEQTGRRERQFLGHGEIMNNGFLVSRFSFLLSSKGDPGRWMDGKKVGGTIKKIGT